MRRVVCGCGHDFDVADELQGGIANCPRCGKAADVPGLSDPLWRVLQVAAALAWAAATAGAYVSWGAGAAAATAVCLGALFWLLSRAL